MNIYTLINAIDPIITIEQDPKKAHFKLLGQIQFEYIKTMWHLSIKSSIH